MKSVFKLIFSYLVQHAVGGGRYENLRLRTLPSTRNVNQMYFVDISLIIISCLAQRTISHDSWRETDRMVEAKVLTDERSTAYVTDIHDINMRWLECKECNWYKSKQSILSEVRLSMQIILF